MKIRIKISGWKDVSVNPRYTQTVHHEYANVKMDGASPVAVVAQLRKIADDIERTAVK